MSDQFYDYLSKKLINYFYDNDLLKGEKFFIRFDEDQQVEKFYNSLKNIGSSTLDYSDFIYVHESSGAEFKTFSINIESVKLVVCESLSVNLDYIVTLRNKVTTQERDFEDTALLVICNDAIDSIYSGMRNLEKEGMPLNVNSISEHLMEEIDNSRDLSPSDKQISKFSLLSQEEDFFKTTLWDYTTILSIINKGYVNDDELYELNLFKDNQLKDLTPHQMDNRLKENKKTFLEVKKYSQYGNKKEQLEKMFTDPGVQALMKDDWYKTEWKKVKKSKDDFIIGKKPLVYFPNDEKISENGLVYWERSSSSSTTGKRKRNIIVFNQNHSNKVILKFNFKQQLKKKYINQTSLKIANTSGKSLIVSFDISPNEPTFKTVKYKHKNEPSSEYTFNIVVLNASPEVFNSIKSRYSLDIRQKRIRTINNEDSGDLTFGIGPNNLEINIEDENQDILLSDEDTLLISEQSPAWVDGQLSFKIHYKGNTISFLIKEETKKTTPVNSSFIWNLKRKNKENIVFNGVKAIQDVNSYYLTEEFKKFLNMEKEIIKNDIFYGRREIDGLIIKEDVSYSEELEKAYMDILNYYKTFDDTPEDNLPSLVYINDDLKELYENFIEIFNKEVEEIENNSFLSDYNDKKDLLKLGRIDENNTIMYSPLSPINIAYQLEIYDQSNNEDLSSNILERLVPNNLIPYITSDDGNVLYRPIFQKTAHEWLIYENSEDVSIGTTNMFISNVVSEKLNQFVKHFNYLFDLNYNSPIKINLINIKDDKEVVKGVFDFIRSRLPDKTKTKPLVPVEINIYSDSEKSSFDTLFQSDSEKQLLEELDIKVKGTDQFDPQDIIHIVQENISYFNHSLNADSYEYAHISFYKVKSHNHIVNNNMEDIDTGLSLNGLLSSVTSTTTNTDYRTGFGTKNILNYNNVLVKTTIHLNELVENSKKYGKITYSKNKSLTTTVELEDDSIEELYDKSHWITFIEPNFGLEYFNNLSDLFIIHYSDQYTSSSKYDTITVTNKTIQYEESIKSFLKTKNIDVTDDQLVSIINMFNSINGEWLLRIISNNGQYDREKLSIISAIKYCLSIYDHDDIVWIPISLEEVLRIAGNVKLDKNKGVFNSELLKGNHSDDLLFIGVKFNNDDSIELIFYPIEVKIGENNSGVIKKGKKQLDNTYKFLKRELKKINNEGREFKNRFTRNFFIQILLSNEQKFISNHIWDEKDLGRIEDVKAKLLNDEYYVSYALEQFIGKGALVSFKKDASYITIFNDEEKQIIEIPEDLAYSALSKSIQDIHTDIILDGTDIHASNLLYNVNLTNIQFNPDDFIDETDPEDIDIDTDTDNDPEDIDIDTDTDNDPEDIDIDTDTGDYHDSDDIYQYPRALIGTQKIYNKKVYWEFGHPDLANRHMLIQGKSGQGKTYFIQRMIKEISNANVPSIIIDYTDGFKFSQLDPNFKDSLNDKIKQYTVIADKFPLNPFKRNKIEIDEGIFIDEDNSSIASRFKSIIDSVYGLGPQQSNTLYQTVLNCLNKYDDSFNLTDLKEELMNDDSPTAQSVLNKLNELLDKNPFESTEFDWSVLDNHDGSIFIIQLTALSRNIQTIITEFILWDLWNYKSNNGKEENPFVVVLDEAHNLDFGKDTPCSKILLEGRKFGWSGWFATQSLKGSFSSSEISKFENVAEEIYFHPTDVQSIAKEISSDGSDRKNWEKTLNSLNKGDCIVKGSILVDGKLSSSIPLEVKVDEITKDTVTIGKKTDPPAVDNEDYPSTQISISEEKCLEIYKEFIDSQTGSYLTSENGKFIISRRIKGQGKIYGKFDFLDLAREYEKILIENAWETPSADEKSIYGRFIRREGNEFIIERTIEKNKKIFGRYHDYEEALNAREDFILDNWGLENINFTVSGIYGSHINFYNDIFSINRSIDGELYNFGKYDTLEDAKTALDILESSDWDGSKIPETLFSWRFFCSYNPQMKSWEVSNLIHEDYLSFGFFPSKENTKKAIDILISNKWKSSSVPLELYSENSNIRTFSRPLGKVYVVVRRINGELESFGSFDSYEDAIKRRDELFLSDWNITEDNEEYEKQDEFIYLKNSKYYIRNEIDGIMRIFGKFDTMDDALEFRIKCMKEAWNLPSQIDNSVKTSVNELKNNDSKEYVSIKVESNLSSWKNVGWTLKKEPFKSIFPISEIEGTYDIAVDGIPGKGSIHLLVQLYYDKNNSDLINYFKELYETNQDYLAELKISADTIKELYSGDYIDTNGSILLEQNSNKSAYDDRQWFMNKKFFDYIPFKYGYINCDVLIDDFETSAKIRITPRLIFKKNSEIQNYLRENKDKTVEVEIKVEKFNFENFTSTLEEYSKVPDTDLNNIHENYKISM